MTDNNDDNNKNNDSDSDCLNNYNKDKKKDNEFLNVSNDDIYLSPPLDALLIKYYVVVIETIYKETQDEEIFKPIKRGIYTFTSKKTQNRFTTLCNHDSIIAYQFDNIKQKEKLK